MNGDYSEFEEIFEAITEGAGSINALLNLGITGVAILVAIISAIVAFVTWVVVYVVGGIPVYSIAKKTNTEGAILAWVPVFTSYFRTYLLAKVPGNKPFEIFGKKIESRSNAFWIYLGIRLAGPTLITIAISIASVIPIAGIFISAFGSMLYLIPPVATAIMEYVFLKDILDMFKEDEKSNNTAAIVVTVLDALVTGGLAQSIYLYSIIKKEPLQVQTVA